MNLRCSYCQTPFTIGRAELLAALQHMSMENQHHYDAHCPRCRKANSVARQRMEMVFPNWQQVIQEQAATPAAPEPAPEPVKVEPVVEAEVKVKKPAPKKPAAKKTASTEKKKKAPSAAKKK